jgi:hypothetical protein
VTKFAMLGAAALLSLAAATPSIAQEVIYNPGYCAQFYPNANCQNKGPNNPYTGGISAGCSCATRMSSAQVPARLVRSSIAAAVAGASIAIDPAEIAGR